MGRFFRRRREPANESAEPAPAAEGAGPVGEAVEAYGVARTRRTWFSHIGGLFQRGLDDDLWDELEETLIAADTGVETTAKVLENLRQRVRRDGIRDPDEALAALKKELITVLQVSDSRGRLWGSNDGPSLDEPGTTLRQAQGERPEAEGPVLSPDPPSPASPGDPGGSEVEGPAVILVVGVNGTGKTTSIGKLAHSFLVQRQHVLLAAADTFRAAAIDQLKQWGEKVGVDVIAHQQGADPGAVVFDTLTAAEKRDVDVVIIDTAGRLHTKVNLMQELRKVNRVIQRKDATAPHEVLLVLDATSGQNALHQAKYFTEAVSVTGVLLAKLDGTAKGGVIFAVCDKLGLPVRFVGTGEEVGDLAPFEPAAFVEALFA